MRETLHRGCCFVFRLALLIVLVSVSIPSASAATFLPDPWDSNPPAGDWVGRYIDLRVRFTDPDGIMVSSLYMSVDGISLVTSWDGVVLYATSSAYAFPDGPHDAEARASDQLGNGPTVLSWSFLIDTTVPVVKITSPQGNPEIANGSVTLMWTGTDTGSGIDHYVVHLDNGPSIDVGNATTFPFHDLGPGLHYFYVTAYDVAGNYDYYNFATAVATVPRPPPPQPPPANTIVVVSLPGEVPPWGIAVIVISLVEFAAIIGLALRQRKEAHGGNRPDE